MAAYGYFITRRARSMLLGRPDVNPGHIGEIYDDKTDIDAMRFSDVKIVAHNTDLGDPKWRLWFGRVYDRTESRRVFVEVF
jgi:hypothetical protein